jgi:hypothetical protein
MPSSLFDTYMSGISGAGQQIGPNTKTAGATWLGSPEYQQGLANFYAWRRANPHLSDAQNPYYDAISEGGSARAQYMARINATPQETKWIEQAFRPTYGYVTGGSQAAGGLLRQGYEDAFRARTAGFAGQQAEQQRAYGAQVAGQGLSQDVAQRMIAENRIGGLQNLAASRAQYAGELNTGLAQLAKGTGTELAGLSSQEAALMANYQAALKGAQATNRASSSGSVAQGIGTAIGAAVGLSDPRLKKNVEFVGMLHVRGRQIPVFDYNYTLAELPGRYRGVMAPDVEFLGVVSVSPAGWKQVDYMALWELTGFSFMRLDKPKSKKREKVGV